MAGQDLGAKNFTPAYLAPTTTGDMVLEGVNYASSGSGILNNTGTIWGGHISLDEQISNFVETKQEIVSRMGRREAKRLLKHKALFMVVTGANDFLNGQQLGIWQNNVSSQEAYLNILTSEFKSQLTRLYHLEARKIIVTNMPRIGCSPYMRDNYPDVTGCVASLNPPIQSYNNKLKSLLKELTANLVGFQNIRSACCHSAGAHGGVIPCFPLSRVCSNRTKYVFWDAFHLTETSNLIAAKHMMDGGLNYMLPMNIRQLLHS
ncbi:Lipase, GDSL [Corchorus olitorius]|uniref:Lipase, GDSL n=1 Tax=Corchorus olitorius TaxID=93759 RepID=A0A1R3GKD9_9ROSI|nr:Lipase, GDSL [Corchorus olitorius]